MEVLVQYFFYFAIMDKGKIGQVHDPVFIVVFVGMRF